MSDYSVSKKRKLVRCSKKKSFMRILFEDVRFYGFIVILSFLAVALVNLVKAAFSE